MENKEQRGSHYKQNGVDPLTSFKNGLISKEEYVGFLKGNVIKYICRFEYKGTPIADLEKARDYINMLLEFIGEEIK